MGLHPIFSQILNAQFPALGDTYRGWSINFDFPPIPCREFDWSATHPDYDGADDANDNRVVHGRTRDDVMAEIDAWYEENEA
jgi:hypothetical protein